MSLIKKYDIWIADLNPRFGTESGKIRPVLIVQNDVLNNIHPSILICPLTTNVLENTSYLRVNIDQNEGLEKRSAIMIDQLRSIDKSRLKYKVGNLDMLKCKQVEVALTVVLDL